MERSTQTTITKYLSYFPFEKPYLLLKQETEEKLTQNTFPNGFCYQEFSVNTNNQEHIKVSSSKREGFYFIYCWKGELLINTNHIDEVISPFQSAIIYNKTGDDLIVKLNGQGENQFCFISFRKPNGNDFFAKHIFYQKFQKSFCSQVKNANHIYIGQPYLKLFEKINSLSRISKDDLASELIMQGLILQVLGLKMEQILSAFPEERQDYGMLN